MIIVTFVPFCVVVTIGFEEAEFSVTEGMVVTLCVQLREGQLQRDTVIMLSTQDGLAVGESVVDPGFLQRGFLNIVHV